LTILDCAVRRILFLQNKYLDLETQTQRAQSTQR
jgi:hypothetical protein